MRCGVLNKLEESMETKSITRDELVKLQNAGKPFKLVDVLDTDHYEREHIKGAISIPLLEIREKAKSLLKEDDLIITYCSSFDCNASSSAAKILLSMGYTNVYHYAGGLKDYKEANLPMEGTLYSSPKESPVKPTKSILVPVKGNTVSMKKNPLTLVGRKIKVGTAAPSFKVIDKDLQEVTLDNFAGKIKVLTSFVSIDTPVCDMQVKEFNKRAVKFGDNVVLIGISKDLPFAQQKFCEFNDIKDISVLSDYKTSSFGINYSVLIKENNLLARTVIILDSNDNIRYMQIVPELTDAPDYADALKNLEKVVKSKPLPKVDVASHHCVPCEAGTPPYTQEEIDKRMPEISGWELVEGKKLVKEFKFKDFVEAKFFFDLLAVIAEEQGHHPNFTLIYNKLKVTTTTHAAGGLTNNDFLMAKIIDDLF
jgi:thiol peroxidase